MHRVIAIDLDGQADPFRAHEDAYDALRGYLDQASARLATDPDRAEVLGDLERSIGSQLRDRVGPIDRNVTLEDVRSVLGAIGPVGVGDEHARPPVAPRTTRRRRRLARISEGQDFFGVCNGLAAYAQLDVGWVRTIFFFLALVTAGVFGLVYFAMALILPVEPTEEAWIAAQDLAEEA